MVVNFILLMKFTKSQLFLILSLFFILFAIGAWFIKSYKLPPALNSNVSLVESETGETISIQNYKGQYILLGYFQTWCGDCIRELRSIDELQTIVGKDKLKVIMVSDEPWEKIKRFKEKYCNTLDYYHSPQTLNSLDIRVFPTTYLLGKKGETLLSRIGNFDWSTAEVIRQIR